MLQILLENTLNDFFAAEDNRIKNLPKSFISYNPISDQDLAIKLPRNTKYLIQQWRASNNNNNNNYSPIINLILMPQRMSWITGKMPVVFFKHQAQEEQHGQAIYKSLEDDLAETIAVIDPRSRFEPQFCSSLQQIQHIVGNSSIIPFLPSDGIAHLSHYFDPDNHYELLSKRALALSGIPTPKAHLIDFDVPETGWNDETLSSEVSRAITTIQRRHRPFVLKTNSAGGTKGTYLVCTFLDQVMVEKDVTNHLHTELQRLNKDNAHLHPCTIVLTHFLPGVAISINFYVQSDGQAQFSSACEQNFSESGHWLGGTITYSIQDELATKYAVIIQKTAEFLRSRGYHGPTGIDIMTDEAGQHNVVDLNPRPTGSFVLGCLRSHFTQKLNMDTARVMPFMEFSTSREIFAAAFDKELRAGEVIVLAWFSDPKTLRCSTCLTVGGKDKSCLERLRKRIVSWVENFP